MESEPEEGDSAALWITAKTMRTVEAKAGKRGEVATAQLFIVEKSQVTDIRGDSNEVSHMA